MTTFIRLLDAGPDEKGAALAEAAAGWRAGTEPPGVFQVDPESFEQVPGSPFAYWVSERVRRLFTHGYLADEARGLGSPRYNPGGLIESDRELIDFFRWAAGLP